MKTFIIKGNGMKDKLNKHKKLRGSLTLEAALVLPVFIFTILAFIYLLQVLILHNDIQEAITEIGLDSAKYGYVYESLGGSFNSSDSINNSNFNYKSEDGVIDSSIETLIARSIDSIYFKTALYKKLDVESVNDSIIKDGFTGIHTFLSSYMDEGDEVDVILNYNIKLPLAFINIIDFQMVQRVKLKSWNGYRPTPKFTKENEDTKDKDEEMVFITATGNVYHTSDSCSHISLSIRNVPYNQLDKLRNKAGGKYKSCSLCWSSYEDGSTVYITASGDRYHGDVKCSGLKRTVTKVPISKVIGRKMCKRCGN